MKLPYIYWIYDYHLSQRYDKNNDRLKLLLQQKLAIIQLRYKGSSIKEYRAWAEKIIPIIKEYDCLIILNDNVNLTSSLRVDGVHLGQTDMQVSVAYKTLNDSIIGLTCHSVQEIIQADLTKVSYLGIGTIFSSTTKSDLRAKGVDVLAKLPNTVCYAIGGITLDNIDLIFQQNHFHIAIGSLFFENKNAFSILKQKLSKYSIDL